MNPESEFERVRLRCVCDDDGCWRWSGSRNRDGLPALTRKVDGERKTMSARRWVLQLVLGRKLLRSEQVVVTCETQECLNPKHLKAVTRGTIQRRTNDRDPGLQMRRGIAIKLAWNRKGKGAKLTAEQADYARDRERPAKDVAAELGCSVALVNYIRNGRYWRQVGNPFQGLGG